MNTCVSDNVMSDQNQEIHHVLGIITINGKKNTEKFLLYAFCWISIQPQEQPGTVSWLQGSISIWSVSKFTEMPLRNYLHDIFSYMSSYSYLVFGFGYLLLSLFMVYFVEWPVINSHLSTILIKWVKLRVRKIHIYMLSISSWVPMRFLWLSPESSKFTGK